MAEVNPPPPPLCIGCHLPEQHGAPLIRHTETVGTVTYTWLAHETCPLPRIEIRSGRHYGKNTPRTVDVYWAGATYENRIIDGRIRREDA